MAEPVAGGPAPAADDLPPTAGHVTSPGPAGLSPRAQHVTSPGTGAVSPGADGVSPGADDVTSPGADGVSPGAEDITFAGADDVTPAAVITEVHRPVAGLSRWIAGAHAAAAATGRTLYVLTGDASRITYPLALVLAVSGAARWVVRSADGTCHDGLSGQPLQWDGVRFAAAAGHDTALAGSAAHGGDGAPATMPSYELYGHGSLRVDITGVHSAAGAGEIGITASAAAAALTGSAPAGWGTGEPVTEPWSEPGLTTFARGRAPRPTSVVVTGGTPSTPAVGLLQAEPAADGVHTRIRLAFGGYRGPGTEFPRDLEALPQALAHRGEARAMLVTWQPGPGDTTRPPGRQAPSVPVGLFAGHEIVSARGVDHARAAPADSTVIVGSGSRSACWCRFGTATPHQALIDVMNHFRKW